MTAQLRDGPWTASPSTTRRLVRILGACADGLAWSGLLIGLLVLASIFFAPASVLLERLLVW